MTRFARGFFSPENPEKYSGNKRPEFRSSWEFDMMQMCDTNPAILSWASESIRIPYVHPFSGLVTTYVPDFLIHYQDATNNQHVELIEVKPSSQTTLESARSLADKQAVIVNAAKWEAAAEWCAKQGIRFRILNEQDIYVTRPKRKPKPRVAKKRKR
jgi:hypothetical protein